MRQLRRRNGVRTAVGLLAAGTLVAGWSATPSLAGGAGSDASSRTTTPVKHVVVLFGENISFDHYFGTYPHALNPQGQPAFHAATGTQRVNGLTRELLTRNPNTANPKRLDRSEALTCDQDHGYTEEQEAFDHGLMDKFVQHTQSLDCSPPNVSKPGLVMDYYDGNTVTALWNYAQHFSMSDNSYGTNFGPSTPGALNLVSGQIYGGVAHDAHGNRVLDSYAVVQPNAHKVGTVINDPDPYFDDCSNPQYNTVSMSGRNVGDLLNAAHVSWGFFQGGFRPTSRTASGQAVCARAHKNIGGVTITDYVAHREPFNYYASTANRHHLAPASVAEIGHDGRANHQYDTSDFYRALDHGNLPAVSFLKAANYQSGHAGDSDPLDEQHFVADSLNRLQRSPLWSSTAVIIAYDDSDGWYDHQMSPIVNDSQTPFDALSGKGMCGARTPLAGQQARCGYGPRLPLLVVSPYARVNKVDHSITDQTSVLRFIEDNWQLPRIGNGSFDRLAGRLTGLFDFSGRPAAKLFLDPRTGEPRSN